uniref:Uncharacterized protein n=1 Tax=Arundo donax TaxID=35708 RepID=A0A0A8Z6P1_ARUDO
MTLQIYCIITYNREVFVVIIVCV